MVVLSKFVNETLKNRQCDEVLHPNGCIYNALYSLYRFTISNGIYFAPVVFMPLMLKIKKLNSELVWDTIKYYMETVLCGTCHGWSIQWMICVLRNYLGEFRLYTLAYIPAMIGGLASLLVASKKARRLFFTSMIQCAIETELIKRKNPITKLIAGSLSIRTFIFMCCSALILHAKRHNKFRGFWFLIPNTKIEFYNQQSMQEDSKEVTQITSPPVMSSAYCTHSENSCDLYITKGIRNYIMIGLTLDLIKMLMNKTPTHVDGFLRNVLAKLRTYRLSSTGFLASYIGIYRFLHCYFNRKTKSDRESNHIFAAFFGGIAFMLYPKLTLQCYGIVLSMELLYKKIFTAFPTDKNSTVLKYMKRLPLAQILYVISLSSQIHTYIFRPQYVGAMGATIINGVTDSYAKRISINVQRIARNF